MRRTVVSRGWRTLLVALAMWGVLLAASMFVTSRAASSPAEISIVGSGGPYLVGATFQVSTTLTKFTPTAQQPKWAGWTTQVAYDTTVLQAVAAQLPSSGALCEPSTFWAASQLEPTVVAGCFAQSKTATGVLEVVTFKCVAEGTSPLHLVTLSEDPALGTTMFDESAVNIPTDLVDGPTVTCAGPATPTATSTPTSTPPPASPTPTFTPTATPTPAPAGVLCATNVGGPPTLGSDVDCDTDLRFDGVLGDGCADSEDLNPDDPWGQVYTVPVPALLAAAGGLRDNFVTIHDVQAIFAYFKADAVAGSPAYEQDANNNGVKDGWEYDRRLLTGGALGPPDGTITIHEVQVAFAQFKTSRHCSSGYNMVKPLCTTNVGGPPTLGNGIDCDFVESLETPFEAVLGDGCVDIEDTDPDDPWGQIYTVPAPALLSNPGSYRDNAVTIHDVQAIFAYFRAGAAVGSAEYEQDLNGNGVKDGWEYDRRPLPSGGLGPPDGAVTAQDAQAAFVQYLDNVRCSSGYNMRNTP
ncbi:MAG TPA: hypothetical protein VNM43_11260 [Dehalococcoidia bacterium]|nr:hypothetical protein [Dehalococcoidia bacterium]